MSTRLATFFYMGRMSFGSPLLTIDLVDASTGNINNNGSFSDVKVVGSILSNSSVPRNNYVRRGNPLFLSILFKKNHV